MCQHLLYFHRGGEDDDFYGRLVNKNLKIIRFHPRVSQYHMLKHKKESPNTERLKFLKFGHLRYDTDGMNSLVYIEDSVKSLELYTNILVEL